MNAQFIAGFVSRLKKEAENRSDFQDILRLLTEKIEDKYQLRDRASPGLGILSLNQGPVNPDSYSSNDAMGAESTDSSSGERNKQRRLHHDLTRADGFHPIQKGDMKVIG